jgi:hypothetical protein
MKNITILTLLGFALVLPACNKQEPPKPVAAVPAHHEHKAPHGGALAELGEEYAHLEFVLDPSDGTITCYVLDGELENLIRIAQPRIDVTLTFGPAGHERTLPLTLTAMTSDLTQEKPGDCSTFAAPPQEALKGVETYRGKLARVEVKGQRFENVDFAPSARKGSSP